MSAHHHVRTLANAVAALVAATFVLLVFGSTVRAHGAGLACPDWPLCFGEVIPRLDFRVWLEFGHRALAGSIGLVYLGIGVALARDAALRRFLPHWWLGLLVLGVQIVLGGLTVLELLAEWTVASHLLGGNTFSLLLALLALRLREHGARPGRAAVGAAERIAAGALALVVFAQLALGGFVSGSNAGLACGTWPACNGPAWFPTFEGIVGLQVTHRLLAYTVGLAALVAAFVTRRHPSAGRASRVALALVAFQITVGVANVLLRMPVEITLLHSAGAAGIVLATTWLNYEAWRAPLRASEAAPAVLGAAEAR